MTEIKQPGECQSMADIRREIDAIDRLVIALIGRRFTYMQAAAKFKKNRIDAAPPENPEIMLAERRSWAKIEGLNPDVIEKMYTCLMDKSIVKGLKSEMKAKCDRNKICY